MQRRHPAGVLVGGVMAGRGPAPKPDERRAGRQKKPDLHIVNGAVVAEQPELPEEIDWPDRTIRWWEMWGRSPLTDEFTENEWSELLDTAYIHAMLWSPETPAGAALKAASELRQRAAKFGATPEDRLRLRMQFAFAETAEERAEAANERREARAGARRGAKGRRGPYVAEEAG